MFPSAIQRLFDPDEPEYESAYNHWKPHINFKCRLPLDYLRQFRSEAEYRRTWNAWDRHINHGYPFPPGFGLPTADHD